MDEILDIPSFDDVDMDLDSAFECAEESDYSYYTIGAVET